MDMLLGYADESNTPKFDRSKEGSKEKSPEDLPEGTRRRKDSQQSGSGSDRHSSRPDTNIGNSDDSSSSSGSSDAEEVKDAGQIALHRSSGSSNTSGSSSESDTEKSDASKKSEHKELATRDKKTSVAKVDSRRRSHSRSHSRSGSKSRRQRRSSDGRHRRSRSRDRRHKSSRSERKHGRHSRSRSRSRDRRSRHHSHDHRRRRDSHRHRHRSSSRDGHRHRKSSPRRRRRSRSPDRRSHHRDEKRRRSRSPQPSTKSEAAATITSAPTVSTSKPPVFKVAGVKFSRGRGTSTGSFKDIVKDEYMQRLQKAEDVVIGKSSLMATAGPSQVTSSVATVSAGTGVMGPGGLNQVLVNQMQMHLQQSQQYLPGQPGCLTPQQKALNQRVILQSTGRTREQVEAQYGVKIPQIYNENTNNLVELAERKVKRDLLWKKSEKTPIVNTTFNAVPILPGQSKSDKDKFLRLMGCMKGKSKEDVEAVNDPASSEAEQEALINSQIRNDNLEREYESSRRHTHINRGYGLGYTTTMYQPH